MTDVNSIDVVIPSFRLDEEILLNICNLEKPEGFSVTFYIVVDNPLLPIPEGLLQLAIKDKIILVKNEVNLGFSKTRNKGIRLGNSKWLLLLDDDVTPEKNLITAYVDAIVKHPDALGFAGITNFPKPFNTATLALEVNGNTGHSKGANHHKDLMWVPTTNIMLNREKMDASLFDEQLKKGGEDIEFLVRNALLNGEKYVAVNDAVVEHPWWDGGATKRLFRYGAGAAQIAPLPAIKPYTYHDFTNTAESLLLLILASPLIFLYSSWIVFSLLVLTLIVAELLTNYVRSIYLSGKYSVALACHIFWLKSCYEAGYLYESLSTGRLSGFAERIELGFVKQHPSWFRLNKWKIIKMCLIAMGALALTVS